MSVQSQIDRLNAVKQRIRTNLVAQGVTVPDDTKLEAMAEQILSVAGEDGYTPVRGIDYWTPEDIAAIDADIATELAKRGQLKPEFAQTIEDCTDTTKLYVLPDGMIYAWMLTEVESGPAYTNVLPLAINADGTPYVGANGEKGYKTGYRISSSGTESAQSGMCCTGFMSCANGDIMRLKNVTPKGSKSAYMLVYDSSFAAAAGTQYPDAASVTPDENGVYTFEVTTLNNALVDYVRFSLGVIDETSIVTVNEEIAEGGGTTTSYAWASTGHAFVPADYEDRIVDVERRSLSNLQRIEELEDAVENGLEENLTDAQKIEKIRYWDKPVFDFSPVTLLDASRNKAALTAADMTIESIYGKYRSLMAKYPRNITETNLGACTSSATFNPVDILRFDFKEPDGLRAPGYGLYETKPKIIFMTGVHCEWVGVYGVYYALEEIMTNPDFDDIRRNVHIIVIPCSNPYGLIKPIGEYNTPSHVNANGVAPHNNFEVDWVLRGSVGDYNYSGTAPLSELESQYIDRVISENKDAIAFVSCHNYDYDTYYNTGVIWASSATAHMCNVVFRLVDKITKAWYDKYGDALKDAFDRYKTDAMPDGEYRLGMAYFSDSAGTEAKQALKYGMQGVNVEIARIMRVFSGDTSASTEVMSRGAEVYANLIRTLLTVYDPKDKKEYG